MKPLLTRGEVTARAQARKAEKAAKAVKRGVKKVNKKRGGHRFPGGVIAELREYVRHQPCVIAGLGMHFCFYDWKWDSEGARFRGSDPAHIVPEARGEGDWERLVPLCRTAHREQEGRTPQFEAKYGVSLKRLAKATTARWLREKGVLR